MQNTEENKRDAEKLHRIYKGLSEQGKIMLLAYSTAIWDKELADIGARQRTEEPEPTAE